jgi:hypothetical protein
VRSWNGKALQIKCNGREARLLVTYLTLLQAFVDSSQVFPQRRVVVVLDAVVRPTSRHS